MLNKLELLIGKNNIDIIRRQTVLIIGLGGVGGYALETLVRSGINNIIIVDGDIIETTNLNRQIIATENNLNQYKVDEFYIRMKSINSKCNIIKINKMINKTNINEIFKYHIDYLIDTEDTIETKKLIIQNCIAKKIKFISAMGLGNRLDASKVKITDIRDTSNDPVARIIRKFIKDNNIKEPIPVVVSTEIPKKIKQIGSNAIVPSVAGILCTNYIINSIIKQ